MQIDKLKGASLLLALLCLIPLVLFQPGIESAETSVSELRRYCSGPVAIAGTVQALSYSSTGRLTAELRQNNSRIMLFLGDSSVQQGDKIRVFGKASKFSNQCWVFTERVEQDV